MSRREGPSPSQAPRADTVPVGQVPPVNRPVRIAGIASYRGTNLRHIDSACRSGDVNAELVLLISNNSGSSILSYARSRDIEARHLSGTTHPDDHSLDRAILAALQEVDVDVVFLSGYMKKLGPETITHYRNRILNVHPSLLPEFGGRGMYGDRVYEAVLEAGRDETGATIHIVDEEYDHGPIVLNRHVPVKPDDDVERLRNRVRQCERQLCLDAVAKLGRGELAAVSGSEVLVR